MLCLRGTAVIAFGVLFLGCSHTLRVEIPETFHGEIRLICGEATKGSSSLLVVGSSGELTDVHCPAPHTHVHVVRTDGVAIDLRGTWLTTGDDVVREITFSVP